MTIHKSKGLEFPICYFAGFFGKFNMSELKEKMIFDNQYGIILPKVEESYKDTILKTLLKVHTKQEEISERIRLLYVAVTRAKEKMILVIPEQEEIKEVRDIVPTYERAKYNSFLSIMKSIYSILLPYIKKVEVSCSKHYLDTTSIKMEQNLYLEKDRLQVTELSIKEEIQEEKKYSKESLKMIETEEQERMTYGIKIHELLEQIDFKNPKLEALEIEDSMKEKIKTFLSLEIIENNKEANIYKEYEFIYEKEEQVSHGIIDLLIELQDKIIIIDYKLKKIEDQAYHHQLNGYREVIKEKTKKPVECYLYSILDEKIKKIEE